MMKKCHNSSIKNRNKEIGSYFSISPQDIEDSYRQSENRILDSEILLYSTCRSAIKCILENLGDNSKALLPAFTCHAVVEPFCACHYQIFPYQINKDLSIDLQSLDEIVCSVNPAVILIHDYFGFDSNDALKNSELFEKYRNRGIVIIEDLTQSMFSKYKHIKADYFVGSIRKWVGIPDGAFLKGTGITSITRQDIELVEAKKGYDI